MAGYLYFVRQVQPIAEKNKKGREAGASFSAFFVLFGHLAK
jgi:hypothetical protein